MLDTAVMRSATDASSQMCDMRHTRAHTRLGKAALLAATRLPTAPNDNLPHQLHDDDDAGKAKTSQAGGTRGGLAHHSRTPLTRPYALLPHSRRGNTHSLGCQRGLCCETKQHSDGGAWTSTRDAVLLQQRGKPSSNSSSNNGAPSSISEACLQHTQTWAMRHVRLAGCNTTNTCVVSTCPQKMSPGKASTINDAVAGLATRNRCIAA